ncbi:hypothetical protein [Streptomyces sp. NPDC008141]|uniref:hypothetical protein n=1 Tax=Streptomyces sp. NPDC008141 TaxID=3364815 RepID=UPI0036EA76A0
MTMWVPEACTLPTTEQPLRLAEFDALFARSLHRVERVAPGAVRLVLDPAADGPARELARRESACCSFFTFGFTESDDGRTVMEVTAPAAYADVVDALADRADGAREGA